MSDYMDHIDGIVAEDTAKLREARKSYGDSWKKRGGANAFFMLCRKFDRMENQVQDLGYDIFRAALEDTRPEGIIDDIRDLRRYLILVEAEVIERMQNSLPVPDPNYNSNNPYRHGCDPTIGMETSCDCGRHADQPHRYGCATLMGGGDNG